MGTTDSHQEYRQRHGFDFALLSGSDRSVANRYDIPLTTIEGHHHVPRRTLYAIDERGVIRYRWQTDGPETESDIEAVVNLLDA